MKIKKSVIILLLFITIILLTMLVFYKWPAFNIEEAGATSWSNDYLYRKQVAIDYSKVSGTSNLLEFPVLINLTDSNLAATSSGGKVENENGYDIVFMPAGSTSTILNFEIEKYSSTTGELVAWVEIPTLYYSTNTIIYIYYGNENASSSLENISGVWDSNYKGVWHLNDNPSGTIGDSTVNGNSGASVGNMDSSDQISGKINGSLDFDGVNDHINFGNDSSLDMTTAITLEAWVNGYSAELSSTTQKTSAGIAYPQLQVVGDEVYYAWTENSTYKYIWTGKMNINGNNWEATKRTDVDSERNYLDFQVANGKVYYTWTESDSEFKQAWTAYMNTDGTGWSASERTAASADQAAPKMQVVGDTIYYVWYDNPSAAGSDIWTATLDTEGTTWSEENKTNNLTERQKSNPQLQVVGSKIYYSWTEYDETTGMHQIVTGEMNTNGSGFVYSTRTAESLIDYGDVKLQVNNNKIYYVWSEDDYFQENGTNTQIWTAIMNTDGSEWLAEKRTNNESYWHHNPLMQLSGSEIYYAWHDRDEFSNYRLKTASMNADGSSWLDERDNVTSQTNPNFQIVGGKTYYVWTDVDSQKLTMARVGSNIINKGDFYGLGISSTTAKAFINGGVDTFKYNADPTAYSAGAVVSSNFSVSSWKYLAMTYNKANLNFYIDGVLINTVSFSEDISSANFNLILGDDWVGQIDEVRISNSARSEEWIITTYNNQNSPDSFYTVGSEEQRNSSISASGVLVDNGADAINLLEGTTKNVVCSATVSNSSGYSNIATVTAKFYRNGVGENAADNNGNHYTLSGQKEEYCSGSENSGTCSFTFQVYFYTDPTDTGTYQSDHWVCQVTPYDDGGAGTSDDYIIEINSLQALDVFSTINYGTVAPSFSSTGDHTATIINTGNSEVDFSVSGSDLICSVRGTIPLYNQEYSLSSFSYGEGTDLSASSTDVNALLIAPTGISPTSTDLLYWQINLPNGLKGSCVGTTTFSVISPII